MSVVETIPEGERKRLRDLWRFVEWEKKQGDLQAQWRATNLLPGALGEARVDRSIRKETMEPIKRSFYGREEEETETYSRYGRHLRNPVYPRRTQQRLQKSSQQNGLENSWVDPKERQLFGSPWAKC